ncbi:MAG: WS/DGAT domain-containing protein [Deltaproteobacteria bacterium]|nr:WS/DGAT domain-containing protein [Deltaproteobacteria bacterium]
MGTPPVRLRAVDAAWLRMDRATNEMVITSVLAFDQPLSLARVRALVRDRLLPIHRFRERIEWSPLGLAAWAEDPHFDLDAHLATTTLPAPGGDAELAHAVGELAARPLDPDRPLWRLHVVDGYGPGTAVVMRLHHCIGDGAALVAMLLGLTDEGRAMHLENVRIDPPPAPPLADRARRVAAQAGTLARLIALPPDRRSPLRGRLGARKQFALSPPIELRAIKVIAAAHGATVNDVLVAAITAAVRAHLVARGDRVRPLRALMPVDLHVAGELGNHFGMVYAELPIDVTDPIARLALVHRRMAAIKQSPEATVALEVLGAIGLAPKRVEDLAIALFTQKASLMITNVPGPRSALHLDGARVTEMGVWAPVSGSIGLGVSILSYAGAVRIGIAADARRVPDPAELAAAIAREVLVLASAGGPRPALPQGAWADLRQWLREARALVPREDRRVLLSPPRLVARFMRFALNRHRGQAGHATADDVAGRDPALVGVLVGLYRWLGRYYFRLQVRGVERVPATGPVLLVGNHSGGLLPSEGFFTALAIHEHLGPARAVYALVHDFLFEDPLLRRYATRLGMLRAGHASARHAFAAGACVLVYPGSDLDTFRPFRDRNRIVLGNRTGFLKLALREGVPIVPVVTAGTHEQLIVLSRGDRLAKLVHAHAWARTEVLPIALAIPWGVTSGFVPYLPLPTQTTVSFLPPMTWPALGPASAEDPAALARCYGEIETAMQAELDHLTAGRRFLRGQPGS